MTIKAVLIGSLPITGDPVDSSLIGSDRTFGPAFNKVDRYFQPGTTITVSGDYLISAIVQGDVTNNDFRIFGNVTNTSGLGVVLLGSGDILFRPETGDFTGLTASAGYPNDNRSHLVEFIRVGSQGEIKLDGNSLTTGAVPTGSLTFENIGRQANFFSGGTQIETRIYQSGVLTNYWPLSSKNEGFLNLRDSVGGNTLNSFGFAAQGDSSNTVEVT